jgi:hypothetical protein
MLVNEVWETINQPLRQCGRSNEAHGGEDTGNPDQTEWDYGEEPIRHNDISFRAAPCGKGLMA